MPARPAIRKLIAPVQAFLRIEAASGIVLFAATAAALIAANSSLATDYHAAVARFHVWIDDGLMTAFFFVVGLEIRRELHDGSLSHVRQALLPALAAAGGMIVPALIYLAFNAGRSGAPGWGIPMATDIAFAVGVLVLLGTRVPGPLRVLLLALAVLDDLGSILVIAIAYSTGGDPRGLAIAAAAVVALALTRRLGARSALFYTPAGAALWFGLHRAGVEPALAGVICALAMPVRTAPPAGAPIDVLHAVVAFVIMPLFALANAGVTVAGLDLSGDAGWVLVGIVVARIVGKAIGIAGAAWLARATGVAVWSPGQTGRGIVLVGLVGGIGFTVPLLIAHLVFPPGALRVAATLGLLIGSAASAALGLIYGAIALPRPAHAPAASTEP